MDPPKSPDIRRSKRQTINVYGSQNLSPSAAAETPKARGNSRLSLPAGTLRTPLPRPGSTTASAPSTPGGTTASSFEGWRAMEYMDEDFHDFDVYDSIVSKGDGMVHDCIVVAAEGGNAGVTKRVENSPAVRRQRKEREKLEELQELHARRRALAAFGDGEKEAEADAEDRANVYKILFNDPVGPTLTTPASHLTIRHQIHSPEEVPTSPILFSTVREQIDTLPQVLPSPNSTFTPEEHVDSAASYSPSPAPESTEPLHDSSFSIHEHENFPEDAPTSTTGSFSSQEEIDIFPGTSPSPLPFERSPTYGSLDIQSHTFLPSPQLSHTEIYDGALSSSRLLQLDIPVTPASNVSPRTSTAGWSAGWSMSSARLTGAVIPTNEDSADIELGHGAFATGGNSGGDDVGSSIGSQEDVDVFMGVDDDTQAGDNKRKRSPSPSRSTASVVHKERTEVLNIQREATNEEVSKAMKEPITAIEVEDVIDIDQNGENKRKRSPSPHGSTSSVVHEERTQQSKIQREASNEKTSKALQEFDVDGDLHRHDNAEISGAVFKEHAKRKREVSPPASSASLEYQTKTAEKLNDLQEKNEYISKQLHLEHEEEKESEEAISPDVEQPVLFDDGEHEMETPLPTTSGPLELSEQSVPAIVGETQDSARVEPAPGQLRSQQKELESDAADYGLELVSDRDGETESKASSPASPISLSVSLGLQKERTAIVIENDVEDSSQREVQGSTDEKLDASEGEKIESQNSNGQPRNAPMEALIDGAVKVSQEQSDVSLQEISVNPAIEFEEEQPYVHNPEERELVTTINEADIEQRGIRTSSPVHVNHAERENDDIAKGTEFQIQAASESQYPAAIPEDTKASDGGSNPEEDGRERAFSEASDDTPTSVGHRNSQPEMNYPTAPSSPSLSTVAEQVFNDILDQLDFVDEEGTQQEQQESLIGSSVSDMGRKAAEKGLHVEDEGMLESQSSDEGIGGSVGGFDIPEDVAGLADTMNAVASTARDEPESDHKHPGDYPFFGPDGSFVQFETSTFNEHPEMISAIQQDNALLNSVIMNSISSAFGFPSKDVRLVTHSAAGLAAVEASMRLMNNGVYLDTEAEERMQRIDKEVDYEEYRRRSRYRVSFFAKKASDIAYKKMREGGINLDREAEERAVRVARIVAGDLEEGGEHADSGKMEGVLARVDQGAGGFTIDAAALEIDQTNDNQQAASDSNALILYSPPPVDQATQTTPPLKPTTVIHKYIPTIIITSPPKNDEFPDFNGDMKRVRAWLDEKRSIATGQYYYTDPDEPLWPDDDPYMGKSKGKKFRILEKWEEDDEPLPEDYYDTDVLKLRKVRNAKLFDEEDGEGQAGG